MSFDRCKIDRVKCEAYGCTQDAPYLYGDHKRYCADCLVKVLARNLEIEREKYTAALRTIEKLEDDTSEGQEISKKDEQGPRKPDTRPVHLVPYRLYMRAVTEDTFDIDLETIEVHVVCPDGTIQSLG